MTRTLALALALALAGSAARAHHPGEALDETMAAQEPSFEAVDRPAPPFDLADAEGNPVALADLAGKVVVLDFVSASCTGPCPPQSRLLAELQEKVNASPMRDMVEFVTVTTDPAADGPEAMRAYGGAQGLDPANWRFLTTRAGDPEDATRALSGAYAGGFAPLGDGRQAHGAVFHVLDRDGRLAGRFHGLGFDPVHLVLYVNGLTQAPEAAARPERGLWDRLAGLLR